jgi:hypothetical protein
LSKKRDIFYFPQDTAPEVGCTTFKPGGCNGAGFDFFGVALINRAKIAFVGTYRRLEAVEWNFRQSRGVSCLCFQAYFLVVNAFGGHN